MRKITLVGLPVVFRPGSTEQRFLGLLISFFTSCLYAYFTPYENSNDDILATVCQTEIFLTITSSMVLEQTANDPRIDAILTVMAIVPYPRRGPQPWSHRVLLTCSAAHSLLAARLAALTSPTS